MGIESIYAYYKFFLRDYWALVYQGNFSDEITEVIVKLNERNIDSSNPADTSDPRVKNKISYLLVECFQNLIRHGNVGDEIKDKAARPGIFLSRNSIDQFYITSANIISNEKVKELKDKLSHINSLDKDALKELYLSVLADDSFSDKGGAGLGLIEMARKSDRDLEYEFDQIDEEYSFFYLRVLLDKDKRKEQKVLPVESVRNFHVNMLQRNILFLYKGDFSQKSILPVIRMMEGNVGSAKVLKERKLYVSLIEIFQNITKHGSKNLENNLKDGIFMINLNDQGYEIVAGNVVTNTERRNLEQRLQEINTLGEEGLNRTYRDILRNGTISEKGGAGLGLIDIARESKDKKITYCFDDISNDYSFYTVKVEV